MTLNDYITDVNGSKVGYDGVPADVGQCVQLDEDYLNRVCGLGGLNLPGPTAASIYRNYSGPLQKIDIGNGLPQTGDVIFWDENWGGGAGHTGIVTNADSNTFFVFEQNDGDNGLAHIGQHNYGDILGWLRPNNNGGNDVEAQQIAEQRRVDLVNIGEAVSVYDGASHVQEIINNINTLQEKAAEADKVTQIAETRRVQLDEATTKIDELTKELKAQPPVETPAPTSPPAPSAPPVEKPPKQASSPYPNPTPAKSLWQRIVDFFRGSR